MNSTPAPKAPEGGDASGAPAGRPLSSEDIGGKGNVNELHARSESA